MLYVQNSMFEECRIRITHILYWRMQCYTLVCVYLNKYWFLRNKLISHVQRMELTRLPYIFRIADHGKKEVSYSKEADQK